MSLVPNTAITASLSQAGTRSMSSAPTTRIGLPFCTTNALTSSAAPTPARTLAMPAAAGHQNVAMPRGQICAGISHHHAGLSEGCGGTMSGHLPVPPPPASRVAGHPWVDRTCSVTRTPSTTRSSPGSSGRHQPVPGPGRVGHRDRLAARNLILSTPTGTGKSLVAVGAHFAALARGAAQVLHGTDQGTRVGEVLLAGRHLRRRERRDDDRRLVRQRGRADHLLHRGDPRQPRAASRRRRLRSARSSWTSSTSTPTPIAAGPGRCRCSPCRTRSSC